MRRRRGGGGGGSAAGRRSLLGARGEGRAGRCKAGVVVADGRALFQRAGRTLRAALQHAHRLCASKRRWPTSGAGGRRPRPRTSPPARSWARCRTRPAHRWRHPAELQPPPRLRLEAARWEAQLGFVRVRGLPVDELHARHHDFVVVGEVGRLHLLARHLRQLADCGPCPGTEGEDMTPCFGRIRRHRREHRLGHRPTINVLRREARDGFQQGGAIHRPRERFWWREPGPDLVLGKRRSGPSDYPGGT